MCNHDLGAFHRGLRQFGVFLNVREGLTNRTFLPPPHKWRQQRSGLPGFRQRGGVLCARSAMQSCRGGGGLRRQMHVAPSRTEAFQQLQRLRRRRDYCKHVTLDRRVRYSCCRK
eukprot:262898-Amphidinium_carterae.1